MDTTAEGAETQDELALIRQLGCSHIQGYVYGRPLPAADVLARQSEQGMIVAPQGFLSSRPARRTMLRTVTVHHEGHAYTGRVRNISDTGCQLEGLWNVPEGTLFAIDLGNGQMMNAVARWSKDDRMGVEFVQSADAAGLNAMPRAVAS
jgi:hypothetical protein